MKLLLYLKVLPTKLSASEVHMSGIAMNLSNTVHPRPQLPNPAVMLMAHMDLSYLAQCLTCITHIVIVD